MRSEPPSEPYPPPQPYPSYPQAPEQPPYAGAPSAPLAPAYPAYPGYAPYPPYPGTPSMPLGSANGAPVNPYAPYPYPGAPVYPSAPYYGPYPPAPAHPTDRSPESIPPAPAEGGIPGQSAPGADPFTSPSSYPAYPYPNYPDYSAYPGYPVQPGYPANPAYPAYPAYPGYPPYPGYAGAPSMPLNAQAPNPYATVPLPPPSIPFEVPPEEPNSLGLPFPLWVTVLTFGGALILVALSFLAAGALARADWSDSAVTAGVVAFILAAGTVVGTLVRMGAGRRVRSMLLLALAMTLVLCTLGGASISVSGSLHGIQARALETDGNWGPSIREYTLAGEGAPNAPNVARVQDEWGEQLFARHSYFQAIVHFSTVITTYYRSGAPVDRAYRDEFATYRDWIEANTADVPYSDAISYFDTYRGAALCDAACNAGIDAIEPQALYQHGLLLVGQGNFTLATTEFEKVQTRFPKSPYAAQAHAAAAKALYALGQQQLASSCETAVSTYQSLAKQYADTPEGKKAKSALAASQNVTGHLSGWPAGIVPVIVLSRTADPKNFYYSSEYRASPRGNGDFTLNNVAQGNYNIAAIFDQGGSTYSIYYYNTQTGNVYTVHVGPLCPTDFGAFEYTA